MSRTRVEVPQLENMVATGKKKFVRYAEGAQLYSLGLHTFQEIAKEANAECVAAVDIIPERAKKACEDYGIPNWYENVYELIKLLDVEIETVHHASP